MENDMEESRSKDDSLVKELFFEFFYFFRALQSPDFTQCDCMQSSGWVRAHKQADVQCHVDRHFITDGLTDHCRINLLTFHLNHER